ncbi:amidohydrolase family protein [Paraburkholderia oxyphila]|uniref:amidohydrolase family protein n=1 Tax=Paraburkholderia oxyphila TaxID=614212 RepID=UPI000484DAD3|nr:amidohydrolase family protein [Paraburkholderia oxyphila]
MLIIDSQVHIWGENTVQRPWPDRGPPGRETPLGKDELLGEMDQAGVDSVVIVPPFWEGDRNDLALAAAQVHPDRFAVMGRLNPENLALRGRVKRWREEPGMLGLRCSFHAPSVRPWLIEGHMDWVWREAEEGAVPIYLYLNTEDLDHVDRIAQRHPGLRLALDHLCLPIDKKDDEAFANLDKVLELAKQPNIAVKASWMPNFSTQPYPYRNLFGYLRQVIDAFGPQRTFWGSEFSCLKRVSYRDCVTMFAEQMSWLSAEDLAWIMGKGLSRWLGWNPRAAL